MLDWITRGRVFLGLGAAHQVPDFKAYGVPREHRREILDEILDVLELAFAGEPYEYEGRFVTSAGQITPRPFTTPRPELWIGAHTREGLERAGRRADLWLADPQRDVATVARLAAIYRRGAEEAGKVPRVGMFREAWIGDSVEECERLWAPHALAVHRLYYNVGVYRKRFEPWVDEVRERENFTIDRLGPGRFLYGDGGRDPRDDRRVGGGHRRRVPRAPLPPPGRARPRADARGAAALRGRGDRPSAGDGVTAPGTFPGLIDRAAAALPAGRRARPAGRAARVPGLRGAVGRAGPSPARARAIGRGDRVGLVFNSSVDAYALLVGAMRLGAIPVPVNVRFKPRELEYVIAKAGMKLVVCEPRYGEALLEPGVAGTARVVVGLDDAALRGRSRGRRSRRGRRGAPPGSGPTTTR